MNIAVRDVRVDPMFAKLCEVHGFNNIARKEAEQIVKGTAKRKYVRKQTKDEWFASMCPWPCYVEAELSVNLMRPEILERVRVSEIVEAVSRESDVSIQDILCNRRFEKLVLARQCVMYLAKELTPYSYPVIGKHLGGRDHTTIMHGAKKIQRMIDEGNQSLIEFLAKVRERLKGNSAE